MMTLDDFLKLARAGRPLASAETLEFMDRMSDEARRITCRLNASYHTPAEVRELLTGGGIRQALMAAPLWRYAAEYGL